MDRYRLSRCAGRCDRLHRDLIEPLLKADNGHQYIDALRALSDQVMIVLTSIQTTTDDQSAAGRKRSQLGEFHDGHYPYLAKFWRPRCSMFPRLLTYNGYVEIASTL